MKDIAIYGAGGFGREIACLLRIINEKEPTWNLVGFFDDGKEKGSNNEYGIVLGGMEELNAYTEPLSIILGVGNPKILFSIFSKIENQLIDYPNVIAPDAIFLDKNNMSFGKGNLICSGCWISCNVHFGDFNLLNTSITVGHDTSIGSFNTFMPATRISGEVTIGDCNFMGVSSIVLQQVKIGNNTVIGANSFIIRKTKDNMTYVGSPATIVKY